MHFAAVHELSYRSSFIWRRPPPDRSCPEGRDGRAGWVIKWACCHVDAGCNGAAATCSRGSSTGIVGCVGAAGLVITCIRDLGPGLPIRSAPAR